MAEQSSIHLLDVKLLFGKAERFVKRGTARLKAVHNSLSTKTKAYLELIPVDRLVTEDDLTKALEDLRFHTCSSEAYFWEHSYKVARLTDKIPIDTVGRAHIFSPVATKPSSSSSSADDAELQENQRPATRGWQCHPELCLVQQPMINGVISLMQRIAAVKSSTCVPFYLSLDNCNNPARSDCLGHTLHCELGVTCQSLLRPARILMCHFPVLRSMVYRLYELRRLTRCIHAVEAAMGDGNYKNLKRATEELDNLLQQYAGSTSTSDTSSNNSVPVDESATLDKFGKALREVTDSRDTYVTTACDICEQLRSDVNTLKSYEDRKGFSCQKMTQLIEQLYQAKTQHEDLDKFLDSMLICKYCADKSMQDKDVARCAFNKLQVVPTPDCISRLNVFEKSLIKFYLSCVTVIRLGQISNTSRPQSELNAALKGRIAYLPLDVKSNAEFVPHDILNTDGLLLLVAGQPTNNKKVWTSVVDLRKVHEALLWLKENNQFYHDIPAYSVADMERIIADRLSATGDHMQQCDGVLVKKLTDAAKSNLYESFTIQPISNEFPADVMADYQMDRVSGTSANIFDSDLDVKAFPELYPTGNNGMRDATREVKIGTSDFLKSRLLNKDAKFRLNINYLFHTFQVQELSNMCHGVAHMLRTVTGVKLTAQAFYDRLKEKDGEVQSKMFALMSNLRGSKEYFAKLGLEIKWMIRSLGPPTLFVTCSTAEWYSEAFISYLRKINASVPNIDTMTAAELCVMDPVNVSIHFHKKWKAIFNKLIKAKDTPLFGEVSDHFWRIEYQARGAPHVHLLLWIKDAPVLGKNSTEEVKAYINSIITCSKPDTESSPTLSSLVTKFQTHKCNKYCQKTYKHQGKFYRKCRFGFPRKVTEETQLNDVVDCLAVNQSKQPRKRLYHLQRSQQETTINDYNPALLLANQANVDIQYIGHIGSRLPYYITDYMTKHERCEQDDLWRDIFTQTKSLGTNAMSFLMQSVKSRQVGANEAADRLLGHKLYSKSRQTRFADLQRPDNVKRILKPAADLERLLKHNPESTDLFLPHWVQDIYPQRPDALEEVSLQELLGWYEKERRPPKDNVARDTLELKKYGLYLRRRTSKPYIVTHQLVNPNQSEERRETYFYNMLKLFKPWRAESDICPPGQTSCEHFRVMSDQLPEMLAYHERHVQTEQRHQQEEQAVRERMEKPTDDVEPDDIEDQQAAFAGCRVDHAQTAMEEVLQVHQSTVRERSDDDIQEDYNCMNDDQRRIIDKVLHSVCASDSPIHLIVSGQGGTGKSRIINLLSQMVSSKFPNNIPVTVTAPTGLSAFNVSGTTVHRLLSLPIEHGKPADYSKLNQETLNTLRGTLRGLRLLIIDEVSMVSSLTLLFIHLRLTEIMANPQSFGGISVVLFADFLQLPPVKGNQPFVPVTYLEAKQRIGSIAGLDLWSMFQYDELTVNMRQSGDTRYASLLSHVRVGSLRDEDEDLLRQRLISTDGRATVTDICNKYTQLEAEEMSPIILVPRTSQCAEINSAMLSKMATEKTYHLPAIDTLDTIVDSKMLPKVEKEYTKVQDDVTCTGGLEKALQLCIGCKVMLKRNMNVDAGLVNGSVGIVHGFVERCDNVHAIQVKFERIDSPVAIQRESCSFQILKGIFYTRKQFPIMLAFAITIHKSQGLSVHTAIVDAGATNFGPGMVYVALSRVTSLSGLHLIDLDKAKITCDHKAIEEYNRLRQLYAPHLGDIKPEGSTSSICGRQQPRRQKRQVAQAEQSDNTDRSCADDQTTTTDHHQQDQMEQPRTKKFHAAATSKKQRAAAATTQGNNDNQRLFQFCSINSIDTTSQILISNSMNLAYIDNEVIWPAERRICQQMERLIGSMTGQQVLVKIWRAAGDGNCLFRSVSYCITGSQQQHGIIRSYIVNHMLNSQYHNHLEVTYDRRQQQHKKTFNRHLEEMERNGTWGTEQEIIAAANLFDVSIISYNKYANNSYCLQHFSPHFAIHPDCTTSCCHKSIYLVNSSGQHYNPATVQPRHDTEE